MERHEKVKFKRKLGIKGSSLGITLPQELMDYLETKDGDELILTAEKGKHGKFLAIFKEE